MSEEIPPLRRIIQQGREKAAQEIRKEVTSEKVEAAAENIPDAPSIFSLPKYVHSFYKGIVKLFTELFDNIAILNQNLGTIRADVRNIPGLHDELQKRDIDLTLSFNEIAELKKELAEATAENDLRGEVLKEISEKDYFGLMQAAIIESTKALREGRDVEFTTISAQFTDLSTKVKSVLG
jgi:hypothetical protein